MNNNPSQRVKVTFEKPKKGQIYEGEAVLVYDGEIGGGSSITVDTELSETSENPVQNKVITAALGNIEQVLHEINNGTES